jgi:hypothetical protein
MIAGRNIGLGSWDGRPTCVSPLDAEELEGRVQVALTSLAYFLRDFHHALISRNQSGSLQIRIAPPLPRRSPWRRISCAVY